MKELLDVCKKMKYDPKDIDCPTLILVGESEYGLDWSRYCQDYSMKRINNPRKDLIITPKLEGAEGHGIGTNVALMSQLLFDWMDETLDLI